MNPNRVVQRSMESISVPRFSGHLTGIAPVYELCHLFLANVFVDSADGDSSKVPNCLGSKTTGCPGLPSG